MTSPHPETTAIICIGSNEPDAPARVSEAIDHLKKSLEITGIAGPYPTEPAPPAPADSALYANAVVSCRTDLGRAAITELLKRCEKELGRKPEHKTGHKVVIDMDLVVYGKEICRNAEFMSEYFQTGYRQLSKQLVG